MPHAFNGLKQQLPSDQRVIGVVIARHADCQLKSARMQRFHDAFKRRMLIAVLPTRDRRLRTPQALRELGLGKPSTATAGN